MPKNPRNLEIKQQLKAKAKQHEEFTTKIMKNFAGFFFFIFPTNSNQILRPKTKRILFVDN